MSFFPRHTRAALQPRASPTHLFETTSRGTTAFFSTTQKSYGDNAASVKASTQAAVQDASKPPSSLTDKVAQSPKRKTMAELDEELRLKMEGMSGDGGASGVEYENGKAEGLKQEEGETQRLVVDENHLTVGDLQGTGQTARPERIIETRPGMRRGGYY